MGRAKILARRKSKLRKRQKIRKWRSEKARGRSLAVAARRGESLKPRNAVAVEMPAASRSLPGSARAAANVMQAVSRSPGSVKLAVAESPDESLDPESARAAAERPAKGLS